MATIAPNVMGLMFAKRIEIEVGSAEFSLPPPTSVETGGLFAITPGDGRHVLSAGFESKWITVTP